MNDNKAALLWWFGSLGIIPLCIIIASLLSPPQQPKKEIRIIILNRNCKSLLEIDRDDWKNIVESAEELT